MGAAGKGRLPYMRVYPTDYLSNEKVIGLGTAAFGAWWKILLLMWRSRSSEITRSKHIWANTMCCSEDLFDAIVEELQANDHNIAINGEHVTFFSHRIQADLEALNEDRDRKREERSSNNSPESVQDSSSDKARTMVWSSRGSPMLIQDLSKDELPTPAKDPVEADLPISVRELSDVSPENIKDRSLDKRRTEASMSDVSRDNDNDLKDRRKGVKFSKPTVGDILLYFESLGLPPSAASVEATDFYDLYESKGWKVGKSDMKSWKSSANRWKRNMKDFSGAPGSNSTPVGTDYASSQEWQPREKFVPDE